jgi:hypothetical protein
MRLLKHFIFSAFAVGLEVVIAGCVLGEKEICIVLIQYLRGCSDNAFAENKMFFGICCKQKMIFGF